MMATPENCTPSNNCATSNGTTINAKPVAASAMAAKASNFFISKTCDALHHPEGRDTANAVGRHTPRPCGSRDRRAPDEPSSQYHNAQDGSDEKQLPDLDANIEE